MFVHHLGMGTPGKGKAYKSKSYLLTLEFMIIWTKVNWSLSFVLGIRSRGTDLLCKI